MFCPKCGNKIDGSKSFCPDCGEKIKKIEKEEIREAVHEPKINGLGITGFIVGMIAIIIGIILMILVSTGNRYATWGDALVYIILGLVSGFLAITGLVFSIIGLSKKKDAFGVIGIITSVITFILDFVTVIIFITTLE